MARIKYSNKATAANLLNSIENDIEKINTALEEEENTASKYSTTYVNGRTAAAIAAGEEIVKKIRWYLESELSRTPVTPYDDAGIDGVSIRIRTFEDGL